MAAVSESNVDRGLLFRRKRTPEQLSCGQENQGFVEELAGGGGGTSGARPYLPSWPVASMAALIKVNGPVGGSGGADKLQCGLAGVLAPARTSCS